MAGHDDLRRPGGGNGCLPRGVSCGTHVGENLENRLFARQDAPAQQAKA